MNHNNIELTAYCGLFCGDCIRYKSKASELSDNLMNQLEKYHFIEYAEVEKSHIKEFEQFELLPTFLKGISKIKCEIPCRAGGDGCGGSCEIIACVKRKSLDGCWECDGFEECKKFDFLKPFHADSNLINLSMIKKHSAHDWAEFREKSYPWY